MLSFAVKRRSKTEDDISVKLVGSFIKKEFLLSGLSWKKISGFDPSLEIAPRYLKFSTASSL